MGDNSDLKAFVVETAPKLEHHVEMAKKLHRSTNADDEAVAGCAAKPNALGEAAQHSQRKFGFRLDGGLRLTDDEDRDGARC